MNSSRAKFIGLLGIGTIAVVALVFLAKVPLALQVLKVEGRDMEPTIHESDRIAVIRRLGELQRQDIVLFKYPPQPSRRFVKRIVGLPGEVLEIRSGKTYVNGKPLEEEYLNPQLNRFPLNKSALRIPDGSYYVLGDNRDNSNDSRFWGPLPSEFIDGKVLFHF